MKRKSAICICACVAAAAAAYLTFENEAVTVTKYEFSSEKIAESFDGFKICHLSDIHVKTLPRSYSSIIKKVSAERPDIIAVTGDLVDSRDSNVSAAMSLMETLCSVAPVYYVTGNHEERLPTEEYLETISSLSQIGVRVLDGRVEKIAREGGEINIIGLFDSQYFSPESLSGLVDDSLFNLLLIHRPQYAEAYASAGADLALCGHAHGGQIRLPILGGVIAPDQYFFPEYYEGIHRFGDSATIISRGLGNSLVPFRINNRPEIVTITLRKK